MEPEKFRFMCQNSNYSEVYSRMKRIQTRLRCFTLDIFKSVIFEIVKAKSFKKSQNKFLLEDRIIIPRKEDLKNLETNKI